MNKNNLRSEKFDTILANIKQNVSISHDASESLPVLIGNNQTLSMKR